MKKIARRVQQVKQSIFDADRVVVYHGDCLKVMASMPEASVDTIVTDPPYHLTSQVAMRRSALPGRYTGTKGSGCGFMGKTWDGGGIAFDPETWRVALRVAKPGAHLLAFGGTRTSHRLACAIEDAGWEIRDCLMWVYGSGFPKSLDVSKAIDADACRAELTERLGRAPTKEEFKTAWKTFRKVVDSTQGNTYGTDEYEGGWGKEQGKQIDVTTPATPKAARWQGWGTGLKPAWEPIILARKPLDGTVAECVLRHGTGALNVDGCRIGTTDNLGGGAYAKDGLAREQMWGAKAGNSWRRDKGLEFKQPSGRWPPNAIFQHDARCVLVGTETDPGYAINRFKDGAKPFGGGAGHEYESERVPGGEREVWACVPGCPVRMLDGQSGERTNGSRKANVRKGMGYHGADGDGGPAISGSSGGASRFFYTPKASTAERVLGCPPGYENRHPTVKPLDLCRWLCRLTKTPDGGVVLDPFSGSGSIAVAAILEGRRAIAIELEEESANATVTRVQAALKYGDGLQKLKQYKLCGRKKLKRRRRCEK